MIETPGHPLGTGLGRVTTSILTKDETLEGLWAGTNRVPRELAVRVPVATAPLPEGFHSDSQRNSSIPNGKLPMESPTHNFTIEEKGTDWATGMLVMGCPCGDTLSFGTGSPSGCCPACQGGSDDNPQGVLRAIPAIGQGHWTWVVGAPSPFPLCCPSFATRLGTF